jgi:hypothetical protein
VCTAQIYIVRVYRQNGSGGKRLAGVVEIVQEQRSVAFVGVLALGAILSRTSGRGRKRAGRNARRGLEPTRRQGDQK